MPVRKIDSFLSGTGINSEIFISGAISLGPSEEFGPVEA
jgi:hypothetical protein